MPKFRFRLEPILRLRVAERDQRRAALAELLAQRERLDRQLQSLERQWDDLQQDRRQLAAPGQVSVERLWELSQHQAILDGERRALDEQISALAGAIDDSREAVLATDRDVRALDQLREQQLAQYRGDEARLESKLLDEMVAGHAASDDTG